MKNVLHTLGLMAQFCPSLGAQMFVENFGSTLNFLIGGSSKGKLAPETQQVSDYQSNCSFRAFLPNLCVAKHLNLSKIQSAV